MLFIFAAAKRYIRPKTKEGFGSFIIILSFLGMALGVATLIIVMSVMNGFEQKLLDKLLGTHAHAKLVQYHPFLPDDQITQLVKKQKTWLRQEEIIETPALIKFNNQSSGVLVKAMTPDALKARPDLIDQFFGDIELYSADESGIIISERFANRYGLSLGDQVKIVTTSTIPTPFGRNTRSKTFKIFGLLDTVHRSEIETMMVFVHLSMAQKILGFGEKISAIELFAETPRAIDQDIESLRSQLPAGYMLLSWKDSFKSFVDALKIEQTVMFVILTMIILVASLNIISGMTMLTRSKSKDIAIMRTMGGSKSTILWIFLIHGCVIGISGALLGLLLGVLFCQNIEVIFNALQSLVQSLFGIELLAQELYFLKKLPVLMVHSEIILILSIAVGIAVMSTLYPAWRAAQIDPVKELK
jgi:lipoprotein-releasing system permease protein